MTAINTEAERARLDELYALVEAEIFADSVRKLADKLHGVADVEN